MAWRRANPRIKHTPPGSAPARLRALATRPKRLLQEKVSKVGACSAVICTADLLFGLGAEPVPVFPGLADKEVGHPLHCSHRAGRVWNRLFGVPFKAILFRVPLRTIKRIPARRRVRFALEPDCGQRTGAPRVADPSGTTWLRIVRISDSQGSLVTIGEFFTAAVLARRAGAGLRRGRGDGRTLALRTSTQSHGLEFGLRGSDTNKISQTRTTRAG